MKAKTLSRSTSYHDEQLLSALEIRSLEHSTVEYSVVGLGFVVVPLDSRGMQLVRRLYAGSGYEK
jgi:hypothetical protein